jgi:hypothetical protein
VAFLSWRLGTVRQRVSSTEDGARRVWANQRKEAADEGTLTTRLMEGWAGQCVTPLLWSGVWHNREVVTREAG